MRMSILPSTAAAPRLYPRKALPSFSALRLSAAERLLSVAGLVACLWAAVFWAMH
jgi:hypothetical protein